MVSFSQDVLQALGVLKLDALKSFWPVISNELKNIAQNGSVSNDVVQALATVPGLEAALPTFEQNASQDLAAQIQNDLASLAASIQAKAATQASGVQAPAAPAPVIPAAELASAVAEVKAGSTVDQAAVDMIINLKGQGVTLKFADAVSAINAANV